MFKYPTYSAYTHLKAERVWDCDGNIIFRSETEYAYFFYKDRQCNSFHRKGGPAVEFKEHYKEVFVHEFWLDGAQYSYEKFLTITKIDPKLFTPIDRKLILDLTEI